MSDFKFVSSGFRLTLGLKVLKPEVRSSADE